MGDLMEVYHTVEADTVTNLPMVMNHQSTTMVMNHQSTTMVMVTNHQPMEATNPLKDHPIQQQLLKMRAADVKTKVEKRAADMKASQTRKFLETIDNFITTIY